MKRALFTAPHRVRYDTTTDAASTLVPHTSNLRRHISGAATDCVEPYSWPANPQPAPLITVARIPPSATLHPTASIQCPRTRPSAERFSSKNFLRSGDGTTVVASASPVPVSASQKILCLIRWAIDGEMPVTRCVVCAGRVCRALGGDGADWGQLGESARQFSVQLRQGVTTYGHDPF